MISCILLAAGLSERFGSPKALAQLHDEIVIEHLQNKLLQTSCDEIIVVLGAHAELIQPYVFNHKRIRIVYNKHYNFGQTSSVQAGVAQSNKSNQALFFLPVDCAFVQSGTIDAVFTQFKKNSADILIPTYKNKRGHPPFFNSHLKEKILKIPLNLGINSLYLEYPPQTIEINDPGIVESFNTPQELEEIKKSR